MPTLTKKDVERLLSRYDNNPQEALLTSLRIVLGNQSLTWNQAINHLPNSWNTELLMGLDIQACDDLVRHLVETRSL